MVLGLVAHILKPAHVSVGPAFVSAHKAHIPPRAGIAAFLPNGTRL